MSAATSWYEKLLQPLLPGLAPWTVVADPDELLLEAGILRQLAARGFELLTVDDPIAFRYAFEKHRAAVEAGTTDTELLVRTDAEQVDALPYDVIAGGHCLSFSLAHLFPEFSLPVLRALEPHQMAALHEARVRHTPAPLGAQETKAFVLRHAFGIDATLINDAAGLLRMLMQRHYRGQRLPEVLDAYLVQELGKQPAFVAWPLQRIIPHRDDFFAFLQERWPYFVDTYLQEQGLTDEGNVQEPAYAYSGPRYLPLDESDVRVYMDNFFTEHHLAPIEHPKSPLLADRWLSVGLRIDPEADRRRHLASLAATTRERLLATTLYYTDWSHIAYLWAELTVQHYEGALDASSYLALREQLDTTFRAWMEGQYGTLHSLPPKRPAMVHQVPRRIARDLDARGKALLIVLDGMATDQWLVLREELDGLRFDEDVTFAWLPTLTSVSRQALFAGKPPLYFPHSISRTDREPKLWEQFWAEQGLQTGQVAHLNVRGDQSDLAAVGEALAHPRRRVVGLVVRMIDEIMHGMQLGTAGMHNQVRQWARKGFVGQVIDVARQQGYDVYLTADHGNIEAEGCGQPAEGSLAETKGQRVRVYADTRLREQVRQRFPDAVAWSPIGLPDDYHVLFAPGRKAFISEGSRTVTHGGPALEEVVVPLIQVR